VTESSDKTPHPADQRKAKKPYTTPRLETYGDLRKITNRVGVHGRHDGLGPFLRTRP